MRRTVRLVLTLVTVGGGWAAGGCGGAPPAAATLDMGGPDGLAVAQLVEELNDNVTRPKRFAESFAKGAAADAKRYAGFTYYIVGKPAAAGAEATATVSVRRAKDETEAGQVEWTFVKDGDKWKIKSAPLPAGK